MKFSPRQQKKISELLVVKANNPVCYERLDATNICTTSLIHTNIHALEFQVILETLRKASVISFTFREAAADVEYEGESDSMFFKNLHTFTKWFHMTDDGNKQTNRIPYSKRMESDAIVQEHSP